MQGLNMLLDVGRSWVDVAFMLGLFWAVLVHPNRIRNPLTFRIATWMFALSMLTPIIAELFQVNSAPRYNGQNAPDSTYYITLLTSLLKMMAFIVGLDSLTPAWRKKVQKTDFVVTCSCGALLKAKPEMIGTTVPCPQCDQPLTVKN